MLHDLDLVPGDDGVVLTGTPVVSVSWTQCRRALAGADPESGTGRTRLAAFLLPLRWCTDAGGEAVGLTLRPVGLPVDHAAHPGLDWVRERVLGGALDLGLGAVALDPEEPDRVVLLPTGVVDAVGLEVEAAWAGACERLERLGSLAAQRTLADPKGVLRPFGDCDAATLLGARSLRTALAEDCGGLGAAVVPMRARGWTRLALIDPAFGPAAAAATPELDRGFTRPLLITSDELTLVGEGGRPQELPLRDASPDAPWLRDMLYR